MNHFSITGYPRIGKKRELKFAVESFLKKSTNENDLVKISDNIRLEQWKTLLQSGMNYIPVNDFTLYDMMLDTAVMLGAVQDEYRIDGLSELDTYFALARGYQKDSTDLHALPMKKWFNTNYHYIVTELNDKMKFKFNPSKILNELKLASSTGINAKPVIIGPYTFLKLSNIAEGKNIRDFFKQILNNYILLLYELQDLDISYLQVDEPALVMDMTDDDKAVFNALYNELLSQKGKVRILLQTYFGDVRDVYDSLIKMEFDAIGLDFIEGEKSIELIKKKGFPDDKFLFVGVVNGRNIWKNDYDGTLKKLRAVSNKIQKEKIIISTSCSLLHVPYTIDNETLMTPEIKEQFSFAEEKLSELKEISELFSSAAPENDPRYKINRKLFEAKKNIKGFVFPEIEKAVKELQEQDFRRKSGYPARKKIQKGVFGLPLFPTTTIGSFPQDGGLRSKRSSFNKGRITKDEYVSYLKERIKEIVKYQEEIGIDVLVHGEYERNDMVEYFGENLSGFVFTENGWVTSYGMRAVKPPIIFGDVKRQEKMTVDWITYAQSLSSKPMKGMLTGPVTIYNWSFPREDKPAKDAVYQIALAMRDETVDLEKAGIKIIQIDEAALREKLPLRKIDWHEKYLDWAVKAFRLTCSGVNDETQIHTHMCYSDFADIMEAIKNLDADVITIEAAKSDLSILKSLKKNNYDHGIGPGVYDIHSPRVPPVEEMAEHIEKMTGFIDPGLLWVNPDCGLKTRAMEETKASLKNMIDAAAIVRKKHDK